MSPTSLKHRRLRPVWWKKELMEIMRQKRKDYIQKRNSGTVEDLTVYTKVCNQVKWECRKAKRDYV